MKGKTARKLLPEKYRSLFENKMIVCIEYEGLNDDQEREMFQVFFTSQHPSPSPLTSISEGTDGNGADSRRYGCFHFIKGSRDLFLFSERLQAINGPFPDIIREARRLMVDNEQFAKAFRIETARARDFQSIASVAFLIAKAPSQIMPTVASLEKWLNTEAAVDDKIKEDILESFTKFISLVLHPKLSEPVKRGRLSPAEFIMICYFMSLIRKSCTDEEISKAVGDLRDDVRRNHDDIRTNNRVFKTMFTFVNNFRNSLVGKTTTGQRAKRKRDSTEDVGTGRKLTAQVGTLQKANWPKPKPKPKPADVPNQRTPHTNITTPITTPTASTPSRGSAVLQRPFLPQKPETSRPSQVNTAPNRPTHFDPLAVVNAAKLQAGQYGRSSKPHSLRHVSAL